MGRADEPADGANQVGSIERIKVNVLKTVFDEIRALLLAGIRYAWLWRQKGGRRWHLLLRRTTIRRDLAAISALFD